MHTLRDLLNDASERLHDVTEQPLLDAQVLMCHVLGRERSWLYAWPEQTLEGTQVARFEQLIVQRAAGHPVAYLTGRREFWSLPLKVSEHTLIPRPETEHLVEITGELGLPAAANVLDLGTGSGAIALALASEHPDWQVSACDCSDAALAIARVNAAAFGLGRVTFVRSDWFAAIADDARFDLIVSNPPYIAASDPHLVRGDVRFEPRQALVSGTDGLDDIRRIAADAPRFLRPGGWLWLEHGYQQAEGVAALLHGQGFVDVDSHSDLAGHARHTGGRKKG